MKRNRSFFSVVIGSMLGASSSWAALVDVSSSGSFSAVGETVSITISVSGLTSGVFSSLGAFDVDFTFDPAALQFVGFSLVDPVTTRNELDLPGSVVPFAGGAALVGLDRIDAFGLSGNSTATLDALQANSFSFLRLDFTTLALSPNVIALDIADPNLLFLDSGTGLLSVQFNTTSVLIAPNVIPSVIPEPSTGLILPFLLSLTTLLQRPRRRQREAI